MELVQAPQGRVGHGSRGRVDVQNGGEAPGSVGQLLRLALFWGGGRAKKNVTHGETKGI